MSNEADWLDIDEPKQTTRELVLADPAMMAIQKHTKEKLTAQQRNFILCFAESHYDPVLACRMYKLQFKRPMTQTKLNKWMKDEPEFMQAIVMREELAIRASGASVARVVSMYQEISRRNFERDTPETDRVAMSALEAVGKHVRMFKAHEDETTTRRQLPAFIVGVQVQTNPNSTTDVKVGVKSDG